MSSQHNTARRNKYKKYDVLLGHLNWPSSAPHLLERTWHITSSLEIDIAVFHGVWLLQSDQQFLATMTMNMLWWYHKVTLCSALIFGACAGYPSALFRCTLSIDLRWHLWTSGWKQSMECICKHVWSSRMTIVEKEVGAYYVSIWQMLVKFIACAVLTVCHDIRVASLFQKAS